MASDAIWRKLEALSITCGMNQRYDQIMLSRALGAGEWIKLAIVAAAVIALILRIARLNRLSLAAAAMAAVAAVVLVASPCDRKARHYSAILQGWSDLRQDVDSTVQDAEAEGDSKRDQTYLELRYRDLLAKKNSLNARDVPADEKLLEECMIAEERSRGVPPEVAPTDQSTQR
jgi:hypothetical protein